MKGYIICATQRSGSTMLCDDLKSTQVAGLPKEYFNKPAKELKEQAAEEGEKFLSDLLSSASTDNGVFGIKVMSDQINRIGEVIKRVFPEYASLEAESAFVEYFKECHFVYLKRKSFVDQAVSRILAQGTGIHHLRGRNTLPEGYGSDVEYSYENILEATKKVKRENTKWRLFFKKYGMKKYDLIYEDIAKNRSYIDSLLDFLEITDSYEIKPRKIKKIGSDVAKSFVARFREDEGKVGNKGIAE